MAVRALQDWTDSTVPQPHWTGISLLLVLTQESVCECTVSTLWASRELYNTLIQKFW